MHRCHPPATSVSKEPANVSAIKFNFTYMQDGARVRSTKGHADRWVGELHCDTRAGD